MRLERDPGLRSSGITHGECQPQCYIRCCLFLLSFGNSAFQATQVNFSAFDYILSLMYIHTLAIKKLKMRAKKKRQNQRCPNVKHTVQWMKCM